jgi:hypothetical protein
MGDTQLQILIPQLFHDLIAYLGDHPVVLGSLAVFLLLAVIGAWYVLSHHLHVLLISTLCAAGFASGAVVLYRGYQTEMRDLVVIGVFLMAIFPIIYQQALKVARIAYPDTSAPAAAMSKGMAKRAGA